MTSALRRGLLKRLVAEGEMTSQEMIVAALAERGHEVTQATVSRDLAAIGARKSGSGAYELSDLDGEHGDAESVVGRFVEEFGVSDNIVVLKTPRAAAHLVAAAIDEARMPGVVGTVAGDDTVLVVADPSVGGAELAARLEMTGSRR